MQFLDNITNPINGRGFRPWQEGDPVVESSTGEYFKALVLLAVLAAPLLIWLGVASSG